MKRESAGQTAKAKTRASDTAKSKATTNATAKAKANANAAARSMPTASASVSTISLALGIAAVAYAVFMAIRKAWLGDDAFISFRYADNFVHGLGLVYNAGERVEGYSNFLWTVWTAFGMRLGVSPERWSIAWGVFFYAATVALLWLEHRRRARVSGPSALLPLAAMLAAAHPDWQVYATSGLETSMFTFLVTLGYVLAVRQEWGARGAAGAGLAFALAALTRPDGPLFAAVAAVYMMWALRPRVASIAAFAGAFLIAWAPWVIWKIAYYGDFFPNTYYAKSAQLAWAAQGWIYVRLYFARYWALVIAIPVGIVVMLWERGRSRDSSKEAALPEASASAAREMVLALAMAFVYTAYVMRVGGDFMYARLLIPVTPLLMIALERTLEVLPLRSPIWQWAASAGALAAIVLTPTPLHDADIQQGVVDEWRVYRHEVMARTRQEGLTLRRYFDGLPVRIAIVGSQAALAYYARPAIVIEGGAGLTDAFIAHQPIARRGRVGHEKVAPVSYLLRRRVNFTLHYFAGKTLDLDSALPMAAIAFDSVPGRIVTWDPVVLDSVKRRGARFTDVPIELDRYAAQLDRFTDEQARESYRRLRNFYFGYVSDPVREKPFRERAARAGGSAAPGDTGQRGP